MKYLVLISLFLTGCYTQQYSVGDCFTTKVNIYKVAEIGKYGIKSLRQSNYDSFEYFSNTEIQDTRQIDCFDMVFGSRKECK
jgi:hypothetical protein